MSVSSPRRVSSRGAPLLAVLLGLLPALAGCSASPCPELELLESEVANPANIELLLATRCDGEPVARPGRGRFRIEEDGRDVTDAETWQISRATEAQGNWTLVLLDLSDALTRNEDGIELMKESAITVASALVTDGHVVGVAVYDGDDAPRTLLDFGASIEDLEEVIGELDADSQVDPSSDMFGALVEGLDLLDDATEDEGGLPGHGNVALIAVGPDRAGRSTVGQARTAFARSSFPLFALVVAGAELTEQLEELEPTDIVRVPELAELPGAAERFAASLIDHSDSFMTLTYCSPRRSGRVTLKVEFTHNDATDTVSLAYPTGAFGEGCALPEDS